MDPNSDFVQYIQYCNCSCYFYYCEHGLQIEKMSRWQVVDRVRELSTKAVKSGGEGSECTVM